MQMFGRKFFRSLAASAVIGVSLVGLVAAQEGHEHGGAGYGGVPAETKRHHFEVVFSKTGVKVYPHAPEQSPVDASRLTGTATFYHPTSPQPWFTRPLRVGPGQPATLELAVDLSKVPATGAKVTFQVSGLADPAEPTAQFTVPFTPGGSGEVTVTKAPQADLAAIKVQRLCQVSGEELGSMGVPLKVSRGSQSILICCQGCVKAIKADPDKYLGAKASAPAAKGDQDHQH